MIIYFVDSSKLRQAAIIAVKRNKKSHEKQEHGQTQTYTAGNELDILPPSIPHFPAPKVKKQLTKINYLNLLSLP